MRLLPVLFGLALLAGTLFPGDPLRAQESPSEVDTNRPASSTGGTAAQDPPAYDPEAQADKAVAAYNAGNYAVARDFASRYVEWARTQRRAGRRLAEIQFVLGHSRYELQHRSQTPYPGDYREDVVKPLEESFRVLQDNAAFKSFILGDASFELWKSTGRKDADLEAQTHWYLLKSTLIREGEASGTAGNSPEREKFARYLLFYLDRCLEMARYSTTADLYLYRIRAAAPRGLASVYADRVRQIQDLTYFDGGNMRAAALWQHALDSLQEKDVDVDEVIGRFQEAAEACRLDKSKAEVNRQVADYLAVLDLPERRAQTADFARRAYELDAQNPEIKRQYGSALHLLSFTAYASGRFDDALRYAQQAVGFDWQGIEMGHFDLSRAAAELGRAEEAIAHGEEAYRAARRSADGAALQPYAQNFVNILRQFGQDSRADRVLKETSNLGVH